MTSSKYDNIIQAFIETPVFTPVDARAAGIPYHMLSHFCKKGMIERVSRGSYRGARSNIELDVIGLYGGPPPS